VYVFGQRDFGFFRFGDPAISKSPDKEEERNSDGAQVVAEWRKGIYAEQEGRVVSYMCIYTYTSI
jgi:hypothetical protein